MKRGRQFKVWIKQSITSLSNSEPNFETTNEKREIDENDTAAHHRDDDHATSFSLENTVFTCHNIDDAMNALYENEKVESARDFQAFREEQAYDWILDGHVSFHAEQERSQRLIQELKGPDLDKLFSCNSEGEKGSETVDSEKSDDEKQAESDDDDVFGDFQTAVEPPQEPQQQDETQRKDDSDYDDDEGVSSQAAVGACRLEQPLESKDDKADSTSRQAPEHQDEEETLGDSDVPREIFPTAPLHDEERTLFDQEQSAEERPVYETTMDDVASPEGRFTRRQYLQVMEKSDQQQDEDPANLKLPEHLFSNPNWDATLDTLRSMPWQHVPILHHDVDPSIVDDFITQKLSQVDASLSQIQSLLLKRASKQTLVLQKGNSVIHEASFNIKMAELYVERSRYSIAQARGSPEECTGVEGALVLLREFDLRDEYASLQQLLSKVHSVLQQEQELNECVESFATSSSTTHEVILERARQLNHTVYEDKDLARLECLDDLRLRSSQVLDVFRNEIESALCCYIDGLCYNWSICSDTKYARLFQALFAVCDVRLENGQVEKSNVSVSDVVETWSKLILETLCIQAEKCFARALLDPTDSSDSEYDKELITLGYELKQDSRDAVKLISLTHNLVTIRFDFEASCNYLPMVYHRLCTLLTEVLHAHYVLTGHHKALMKHQSTEHLKEIETAIRAAKVDIWRRCEEVLAKCLDQYHNFAAKKTLFPRDKEQDDGTLWMEDLEGLHDVLRLTQQFLSLGHEFLDSDQMELAQVTSLTDYSDNESKLHEKLCEAFRKHLRAIHVEAMTTLGGSLFNESWRLVPLKARRSVSGRAGEPLQNKRELVHEHLLLAIEEFEISDTGKGRYWHNELSTRVSGDSSVLAAIKLKGNPFLLRAQESRNSDAASESDFVDTARVSLERPFASCSRSTASSEGREKDLFACICELIDNEHTVVPAIATDAVNNVLAKWISRLLSVMLKLPLVVDDVTKIFRDLCDLYFITAFRLCAGNARNEKILLGSEEPAPLISQEELEQGLRSPRSPAKKESSGFMGFGRRPSNSSMGHQRRGSNSSGRGSGTPTAVSRNVDAEICAPLPSESPDISELRDFIVAGQINLESVVQLNKLEQRLRDPVPQLAGDTHEFIVELVHVLKKRQAIAWSCLLVAALLDVARKHAEQTLTFDFLNDMLGVNGSQTTAEDEDSAVLLDSLASYAKSVTQVAPRMVTLCSRISCVHAILGDHIVKEVVSVGPGWELSRLNEHSNHYIDETCDRYAFIWHSLSAAPSALPRGILEVTWEHICEGGFLSLLEGFSRVPYCSTEGRSLMSMDLASFSDGIDAASIIHRLEADKLASSPPLISPKRGMRYVDMYIRVFYYPEEDAMKWIVSSYRDYQLNHMLALLTSGDIGNTDMRKLVDSIQALYKDSPRSGEGSAQRQHK